MYIRTVIKMQENENIGFKELYTENIYKEIVAFLNSGSGTIYIGYNDNGELIGLENVKETEEKISNGIRGKIVPDCSVFVSINNSTLDNKDYIIINVSKGVNIYSLKDKGYIFKIWYEYPSRPPEVISSDSRDVYNPRKAGYDPSSITWNSKYPDTSTPAYCVKAWHKMLKGEAHIYDGSREIATWDYSYGNYAIHDLALWNIQYVFRKWNEASIHMYISSKLAYKIADYTETAPDKKVSYNKETFGYKYGKTIYLKQDYYDSAIKAALETRRFKVLLWKYYPAIPDAPQKEPKKEEPKPTPQKETP